MNIVSQHSLNRAAAMFLLTVPPIEELPDELVDVASRCRAGTLEKPHALAYMGQTKSKFLEEFVAMNREIDTELGGWKAI